MWLLVVSFVFQNCGSVKVRMLWMRTKMKPLLNSRKRNILVYGRTADNTARIAFEEALAKELRARGIRPRKVLKNFQKFMLIKKFPKNGVAFVQSILDSEGYNGIVVVAVKERGASNYNFQ